MVRNPVQMAYSLYDYQVFCGHDFESDFEKAWDLSDVRAKGKRVQCDGTDHKLLAYKQICRIGNQLRRFYDQVDASRVHVVTLDDIKDGPRLAYTNILQFLDLSDDNKKSFASENRAKEWEIGTVGYLWKKILTYKQKFGFSQLKTGIMNRIRQLFSEASLHLTDAGYIKRRMPFIRKNLRQQEVFTISGQCYCAGRCLYLPCKKAVKANRFST